LWRHSGVGRFEWIDFKEEEEMKMVFLGIWIVLATIGMADTPIANLKFTTDANANGMGLTNASIIQADTVSAEVVTLGGVQMTNWPSGADPELSNQIVVLNAKMDGKDNQMYLNTHELFTNTWFIAVGYEQLLTNLIDQSILYTDPAGNVSLSDSLRVNYSTMYFWMLDEENEPVGLKWFDNNFNPVTTQTVGKADTVIYVRSSAAPYLQNLKMGAYTFETIDRVARNRTVVTNEVDPAAMAFISTNIGTAAQISYSKIASTREAFSNWWWVGSGYDLDVTDIGNTSEWYYNFDLYEGDYIKYFNGSNWDQITYALDWEQYDLGHIVLEWVDDNGVFTNKLNHLWPIFYVQHELSPVKTLTINNYQFETIDHTARDDSDALEVRMAGKDKQAFLNTYEFYTNLWYIGIGSTVLLTNLINQTLLYADDGGSVASSDKLYVNFSTPYYWLPDEEDDMRKKWFDSQFIPVTTQTVGTADAVYYMRSPTAPILNTLKTQGWQYETIDRVARRDSVKSSVVREITNLTASAFAALSVTNTATFYIIVGE
jgi:hypothetical protein